VWLIFFCFPYDPSLLISTLFDSFQFNSDPSLCEEFATDEPSPYNILSKCVDRELKKRLDAMKFLNNAVAEDIRQEEAAAVVARKGGSSTPKKRMELPKKTSP